MNVEAAMGAAASASNRIPIKRRFTPNLLVRTDNEPTADHRRSRDLFFVLSAERRSGEIFSPSLTIKVREEAQT
jgi:hypothetical protein